MTVKGQQLHGSKGKLKQSLIQCEQKQKPSSPNLIFPWQETTFKDLLILVHIAGDSQFHSSSHDSNTPGHISEERVMSELRIGANYFTKLRKKWKENQISVHSPPQKSPIVTINHRDCGPVASTLV